jgi:hypothetical protein
MKTIARILRENIYLCSVKRDTYMYPNFQLHSCAQCATCRTKLSRSLYFTMGFYMEADLLISSAAFCV